jgi:hypothetical protein
MNVLHFNAATRSSSGWRRCCKSGLPISKEGDGRSRQCDVDAAIQQVIGGAVDPSEVIDLFAAAGPESARP